MKSLKSSFKINFFLAIAITFVVLNYLFYLDEGYFDFRWMKSGGNWIVFFAYWIVSSVLIFSFIYLAKYLINYVIYLLFDGSKSRTK